jgi:hypothetical protein
MAEKELILKISFDTIKELEGQLKKVTAEFKQAAIGSDEFNKKANEIKTLNNELKAVQATTKEVTKETNNLQKAYDIAFGNVEASLGDMQRALRLLKNEGFEGKTKEEIAKLNSAVGTLKNNIQDSVALNKALDKGEVFNNMRAGLQGAVAAAQLLGSALKLMGVESESAKKLEAATLQLMSATQALQVIRDLHDKGTIKALAIQTKEMVMTAAHTAQTWASTTATIARTKAEEAQAVMTGKAGLASKAAAAMQWLWNAAIAASPIGWIALAVAGLAVGIGALVVQMNKQTEAEKKNAMVKQANLEVQNQVNESTSKSIGKLQALQQVVNDTTLSEEKRKEALKLINKETDGNINVTDLSTESLKKLNEAIGKHIEALKKQAEAEAWIQKYQEGYKKLIDYQTDVNNNTSNGVTEFVLGVGDFFTGIDAKTKIHQKNQVDNVKKQEELNNMYLEGIKKTIGDIEEENKKSGGNISGYSKGVIKEVIDEVVSMRKKLSDIIEKERQTDLDNQLKQADDAIKIEEERLESLLELYRQQEKQKDADLLAAMNRIDVLTQYEIDKSNERLKKELENEAKKKEARKQAFDSTATIVNTLASITNTMMDMELAKAGDNEEKKNRIRKQYADKQAAISIAQIIISTAQSIMQGYGQLGPIGGTIAAVLMAALGAVEINAAMQQRKMINAAAGGGDFETTKPTLLLVGDNPGGVEHVSVTPISGKGQTKVNPSSGLIQMAGGGSIISDGGLSRSNNSNTTISTFLKAIKEMPAPILDLQEFTIKQEKTTRIKERANL